MNLHTGSGWELDPCCPCDGHFVEYVRSRGYRDKTIFHFGSGKHHLVGSELAGDGHRVLSITATPAEYTAYMERVVERPELGHRYRLIFGDIYAQPAELLPTFDLVTLFHLCEGFDPQDAQAVLRATATTELFLDKLNPGGEILFYKGSNGKEMTRTVLATLAAMGRLTERDEYESLRVFGV
jgi:hypothetical protein